MQNNRELYELALSGNWSSAITIWMQQNSPCSRQSMVESLMEILPRHHRCGDSIMPPQVMIKHWLRCYMGIRGPIPEQIPKYEGGRRNSGETLKDRIMRDIRDNGPACLNDYSGAKGACKSTISNLLADRKLKKQGRVYYLDGQDPADYEARSRTPWDQ